jgi:hypothetical protein
VGLVCPGTRYSPVGPASESLETSKGQQEVVLHGIQKLVHPIVIQASPFSKRNEVTFS